MTILYYLIYKKEHFKRAFYWTSTMQKLNSCYFYWKIVVNSSQWFNTQFARKFDNNFNKNNIYGWRKTTEQINVLRLNWYNLLSICKCWKQFYWLFYSVDEIQFHFILIQHTINLSRKNTEQKISNAHSFHIFKNLYRFFK